MTACSSTPKRTANALFSDLLLVAWLIADAVRYLAMIRQSSVPIADALIALALAVTAIRLISRRPARQFDASLMSLFVVAASMFWSTAFLLLEPPPSLATWPGVVLQTSAAALIAVSMIFLGSSFTLLPAARSLVQDGPYAFVRHPIYSGYLLFDLVIAVQFNHWLAIVIWGIEAVLLSYRAVLEEKLLLFADSEYAAYRARVTFRLCPGVF